MADLAHRKSTKTVRFTDTNGNPIAGRRLKAEQISHKFLFGCGGFDFVSYYRTENEYERSFYKERMDKWLNVFNYATLPFYLGRFEAEEGKPETESRMLAAKYLTERGRHPLFVFGEQKLHNITSVLRYDNTYLLIKD